MGNLANQPRLASRLSLPDFVSLRRISGNQPTNRPWRKSSRDAFRGALSSQRGFTGAWVVPIKPMVLLIGNYSLDRQQSMQRFTTMMLQGLTAAGIPAEIAAPAPVLGKLFGADNFLGKWFAYIRSEERRVGKECRSRWSTYH